MDFYIVDCFAEAMYQGNQLLVVNAKHPISDEEQQKIAREINFSETAFILSDKKQDGGYEVRIWTPNVGEVPFAGHPTLGTAYVIRKVIEKNDSETILLNLAIGQIPVKQTNLGQVMLQKAPKFGEIIDKKEICEVFGISKEEILDEYPVQWVSTGLESVLIPLTNNDALSKIKINREAFREYIKRYPQNNCNHLFFTQTGKFEFAARCMMEDFVEDPATGSANGNLAGYLIKHGYFGKKDIEYTVVQGEYIGRKSVLHIHASDINNEWLIEVGGNCHIVASGTWE